MKVLCFGDSNTYGYDPRSFFGEQYPSSVRWTGRLAQNPQWDILEAGQNGREIPSTPYEIHALRQIIEHVSPDLLVIMLGTNDLLNGCTAEEAAIRMKACLSSLPTQQILLIAPPPLQPGAWVPSACLIAESRRLSTAYRTLAQQLHIGFAAARDWNVELLFDGVHFSESGHEAFAKGLLHPLKKHFG